MRFISSDSFIIRSTKAETSRSSASALAIFKYPAIFLAASTCSSLMFIPPGSLVKILSMPVTSYPKF
ncbi:hypothetical protein KAS31_00260 [Candidatus Parcubacteria bacterium]|nr:hypothetical protein [Candidatus Parcubacteria bacterium]